jgi:hypothetical protein
MDKPVFKKFVSGKLPDAKLNVCMSCPHSNWMVVGGKTMNYCHNLMTFTWGSGDFNSYKADGELQGVSVCEAHTNSQIEENSKQLQGE